MMRRGAFLGLGGSLLLVTTVVVYNLLREELGGEIDTIIMTTDTTTTTTTTNTYRGLEGQRQQKQKPKTKKHGSSSSSSSTAIFLEALDAFTKVLHDNPDDTGVRPWKYNKSTSLTTTWEFDGLTSNLLHETLAGRKLVLVGDSTLMYMLKWFQPLLLKSKTKQDSLQTMPLSHANKVVKPPSTDKYNGYGFPPNGNEETFSYGKYHIQWMGYAGALRNQACSFDFIWDELLSEQNNNKKSSPHIMVVNFGFHWLHLQGEGRNVGNPSCFIDHWLHYEEKFLEKAVQVAKKTKTTRLLLFKTTNYICQDKYEGDYATAVDKYQKERRRQAKQQQQQQQRATTTTNTAISRSTSSTETSVFNRCVAQLEAKLHATTTNNNDNDNIHITHGDLVRYCKEATFDLVGSQNLNKRIRNFVERKRKEQQQQQQEKGQTPALTIALYNDHDVQSCPFTEANDGRHYHPLNLLRIRLLANMIQALY